MAEWCSRGVGGTRYLADDEDDGGGDDGDDDDAGGDVQWRAVP